MMSGLDEQQPEPVVGNKRIEDAAIRFVIEQERLFGREARDTRYRGAAADIESGGRVIAYPSVREPPSHQLTARSRPGAALDLTPRPSASTSEELVTNGHQLVTAIVAANTLLNGIALVGDTRLTTFGPQGEVVRLRDVCQKLVVAAPWCVVGFAGSLCPARTFLNGVGARAHSYPLDDLAWMTDGTLDWLRDDQQVADYLAEGYTYHEDLGPEHQQCIERPVQLLIAWIDAKPLVEGGAPAPAAKTIAVLLPGAHAGHIDIRRKPWGVEVIGRGAVAEPALDTPELFAAVANMGDAGEVGNALRCMLMAEVLRQEMASQGEATVGGLYQIVHLSVQGVRSFPYFYRARVAPGYSTYVAMRRENGRWIQYHKPSGTVRRVLPPSAPELLSHGAVAAGAHEMFEPSVFLTPESPGVIPDQNLVMAYAQYDADHIPPEIAASWGPDPLPPDSTAGHPVATPADPGEEATVA